MIGDFVKLVTGVFNNIFVFTVIFFLVIGVIFYLILGVGSAEDLTKQTLYRQKVSTLAGANSIKSFFDLSGKSLSLLVKNPKLLSTGSDIQQVLDEYMTGWKDTPVVGIIFADASGKVINNSNKEGIVETGYLVADRQYFLEVKELDKDYYIGNSIMARGGSSKGQYIVPVAAAVVDNKRVLKGVVALAIDMDQLTQIYLNPLKISNDTEVYLLDQDSSFIYSHYQDLIGQKALKVIEETSFIGSQVVGDTMRNILEAGEGGEMELSYPKERGKVWPLEKRIIAYSPLEIEKNRWYLVVATPQKDVLAFVTPFYLRNAAVLVITFLALIIYSVRVAKLRGYEEGFEYHGELHKESPQKQHTSV